ncbi:hypothetical protein ASD25_00470 [Brevundimonas sp. Root1423]|nr:hypothetical protein ASD25_00470 [Brevundimonas sp. Root1423]
MIAPTPGAEPYGSSPSAGDLVAFGDGQTAALDAANRDKSNAHKIVTACEARDAASVREITRPWYRRLLPG